jgi:hypothetical protein
MNISNEDVIRLTCHHVVRYGLGLALEHVADIALDIQLSTNEPKVVCVLQSLQTRFHQLRVWSLCLDVSPLHVLFNLTPALNGGTTPDCNGVAGQFCLLGRNAV